MPIMTIPIWVRWQIIADEYYGAELTIYGADGTLIVSTHKCRARIAEIFNRSSRFSFVAGLDVHAMTRDDWSGLFGKRTDFAANTFRVNEYDPGILRILLKRNGEEDEWPIADAANGLIRDLKSVIGEQIYLECLPRKETPMPANVRAAYESLTHTRPPARAGRKRIAPIDQSCSPAAALADGMAMIVPPSGSHEP